MSSTADRMEQNQHRLAKIEALQQSLASMQRELGSYRDALNRKLGLLQNNEQATAPAPAPARRDSKPLLTPAKKDTRQIQRPPAPEPPPAAAPREEDHAAKRSAPRRKGNPVPVVLTNESATMDPFQGWVLDRSSGGLRILVDQPAAIGTVLSVRPTKAHGSFPWIQIQVRSCQPERNSYALGVQFVSKPGWGEMQAFG
jgi:hypothetical protein